MRLERLNYNKIKIFLTQEDLSERGITKEDIWKDSLKWHQLFHDMLEEASVEFGVEIYGSVAVEIFSMQAQGMIMIVTMEESGEEDLLDDNFIDMSITLDGKTEILYAINDFEEVIQLAKRLHSITVANSSLYSYNGKYFIFLADQEDETNTQRLSSICEEYGEQSLMSICMLEEYGKEIMKEQAIEKLLHFFH